MLVAGLPYKPFQRAETDGKVRRYMGRGRFWSFLLGGMIGAALVLPASAGSELGAQPTGRQQGGPAETAIFYYPWYSTPGRDGQWAHWYVHGPDGQPFLSTPYYPARGLYSSSNAKVVAAHMREIASVGIKTIIVSWWGPESPEALRLPAVASVARQFGLRVAVHIEPYRDRTPDTVADDMAELNAAGFTDFYVYDADRDLASAWSDALADRAAGIRVIGHTHLVGRAKAAGFDGLYTYDVATWNGNTFARICTQAHRAGLLCAPSVGPGYDARLATSDVLVRPRLRGATYDRMWRAAVRAQADVVTVTSYNEWQEGTQIEPARLQVERPGYEGAWGKRGVAAQRAYLDATARWAARFRAAFVQ
jgi:glycoprotein endo-alpha-1,2-mannosidase